ncbi:anaerobic magnesium-protoporphyrin ix monomethyl ester cyclase-related [Anaeramoeba flamelloides]|uniref:Anaerobic magnesium-protoporphyrin ix monomethyl ester cyclase-related n=1 Tax=Anaeramoeba flamelloides TaxID=1746091 RepID=A0ABQ8Y420_9EUKA|nr:anaerobic magnesium-protoporphyrin ix monomethyl ester cyclase-related [Anaeramoeba flamelloides]
MNHLNNFKVSLVNLRTPLTHQLLQPSTGCNVLAGYLRKRFDNKVKVQVVDASSMTEPEEIVSAIQKFNPKLIGFSVKWGSEPILKDTLRCISREVQDRDQMVVLGNVAVTYGYEQLLKNEYLSNAIAVLGEGEEALGHIIQKYPMLKEDRKGFQSIANIAMNYQNSLYLGKRKVVNFKEYPNFDKKCYLEYYNFNPKPKNYYHRIETSRGCSWSGCNFCSVCDFYGKAGWRAFPIKRVAEEIEHLLCNGIHNFGIKDSDFGGPIYQNHKRWFEFGKAIEEVIKKTGKKPNFFKVQLCPDSVYSVKDNLNEKRRNALKVLRKVGVSQVYLGIESGSKNQLIRYNKRHNVEENVNAIKILNELGFEVVAGFIFFDPEATLDDLFENLNFIKKTNLHLSNSHLFDSLRLYKNTKSTDLYSNGEPVPNSIPTSYHYQFKDKFVQFVADLFYLWDKDSRNYREVLSSKMEKKIQLTRIDFDLLMTLILLFKKYKNNVQSNNIIDLQKKLLKIIATMSNRKLQILKEMEKDESNHYDLNIFKNSINKFTQTVNSIDERIQNSNF